MDIDWEKWIIGGIVAVLAVLMWRAYLDRRASPQWPSVPGHIVSSRVVSQDSSDGHGFNREWLIDLEYSYMVNGQVHKGKRIQALLRRFYSEEEALAVQKRFPAGAEVPVFYDPGKPGSSVLIAG